MPFSLVLGAAHRPVHFSTSPPLSANADFFVNIAVYRRRRPRDSPGPIRLSSGFRVSGKWSPVASILPSQSRSIFNAISPNRRAGAYAGLCDFLGTSGPEVETDRCLELASAGAAGDAIRPLRLIPPPLIGDWRDYAAAACPRVGIS